MCSPSRRLIKACSNLEREDKHENTGNKDIFDQAVELPAELLPVVYSDVAAIFERHLFGVHLITGVSVSTPTLGTGDRNKTSATFNLQARHFHAKYKFLFTSSPGGGTVIIKINSQP